MWLWALLDVDVNRLRRFIGEAMEKSCGGMRDVGALLKGLGDIEDGRFPPAVTAEFLGVSAACKADRLQMRGLKVFDEVRRRGTCTIASSGQEVVTLV